MKDERTCINLLKEDLKNQAQFVPVIFYTDKVFSVIIVALRSYIAKGETIKMNARVFEEILKMYPELLTAFDEKYVEKTIIQELEQSLTNGQTKKGILKKYAITNELINDILDKIKMADIELYNQINESLKENQKQQEINIIEDVRNLDKIINSLGPIKNNVLTLDQKVKFAYLCGKNLHNTLEEIYHYDYKKVSDIDVSKVSNFLNSVLKFHYIYKSVIDQDKVEHLVFNNSWYKNYSRDKFFGIKNGVPTIDNKYGKDAKLLTLTTEQVIIEMLKVEEVPLKEAVVKTAFREFFKDNLLEYIETLKSYDQEFEQTKKKSI